MKFFGLIFLFLFSFSLEAQISLSGKITNENGEELEFATIYLIGTNYVAISDHKGYYVINSISEGEYKIKVDYVGYRSMIKTIVLSQNSIENFVLEGTLYNLDKIEIISNKLENSSPFRFNNIKGTTLRKENLGQDLPILLQNTSSVIVSSDAGNGIGYTSLRIRGSDQTRINVTINGVPVNDAESQGVFWVNMPDLAGSVNNIQIQKGVGASTNGAGAFGGTISVNTNELNINPYATLGLSAGSFGTYKSSINFGTGLMNGKYNIEGRYSLIHSDGYIDRARSDLNGLFVSAARLTEKSSLRFQITSGKEVTYQAWNGVPESRFNNDQNALQAHYDRNVGSIYLNANDSTNLFSSDERYNYYTYGNQVDNYRQTQSQITYSRYLKNQTIIKSTLFHTFGTGYFEQFRYNDRFSNYGFDEVLSQNDVQVTRNDLVRRRWLKNHFFGGMLDATGKINNRQEWQAGIHLSQYIGDHFGNIISASDSIKSNIYQNYYDNRGNKSDISGFVRYTHKISQKWVSYSDLQLRNVNYSVLGIDNDLRNIDLNKNYLFFNPKAGLTYHMSPESNILFSFAVAHKEPARSDFLDYFGQIAEPKPERLFNWELAYRLQKEKLNIETGFYFMNYKNQLVLTGNLNDVGASLRTNVASSYRLGWESDIHYKLSDHWRFGASATLSSNKIREFEEIIYDYTIDFEEVIVERKNTDIAYSPNIISGLQVFYSPIQKLELELSHKYSSRQYLDNAQLVERSLPAFSYQNLRISYAIENLWFKNLSFTFLANNILNRKYANNGYTYSYIFNEIITENFFYPQAGRNVLFGLEIKF